MFMHVTFANGVTKLVFEPPDKKGTFLLVDTFADFPKEPTHEIKFGDETHKLYLAETCGFNNTLAELADDKLKHLFFTEEYAKKVRPTKVDGAKFARYLPLRANDTRKHQLDVACGYVEDELYRVKKTSDGFRPVYVVERDFQRDTTQSLVEFYSSNGNFMFAQVDLIGELVCEQAELDDDEVIFENSDENSDEDSDENSDKYTIKPDIEQPTIYEPERGKFYRVVPVQDFGLNEGGVREIYLNGKRCENFSEPLRWSKLSGKVLYEKIPEDYTDNFFRQLMILRGYEDVAHYNDDYYNDSMSDAELLGYPADYDGDDSNDLWDLNGF